MRIDLTRTFSATARANEEPEDWLKFLRKGKAEYYWPDLLSHRVVVVLGEAGIGKTVEFESEAGRLQREGKAAFFIPLNQVPDKESWERVVTDYGASYEKWTTSGDIGHFFFDAIDEARLSDHSAFERMLLVVKAGLRPLLHRVRIFISSRITDWAVESVREAVCKHLVASINAAHAVDMIRLGGSISGEAVVPTEKGSEGVEPLVVKMDALSESEARRLANALGVWEADGFWSAIEDGGYEFMATRPLDLEWMVKLWNEKGGLGTYSCLVEGNVSNRLADVNPSYQQAGTALSPDLLRSGAEQLAAAAEFSGKPFIATARNAAPDEVAPDQTLSDWKPVAISRLLASALFDEATFGRVKFHHRSIREYLAASWVNRQLLSGLPLHRVLHLFSASPFGAQVLIPSRRAALCWLATLNVEVREWVTREFPEMLLFEGDPEAWDVISATDAFTAYVDRVRDGLWTDWWNDASEFRRVARRLPPGRVAVFLRQEPPGSRVITALLPLVAHGRLTDCADVVFEIYRRSTASPREKHYALGTLAAIASSEHRALIKNDLFDGRLSSNELIGAGLTVVDWKRFSVEELGQLFEAVRPEPGYGSGPMGRAIKDDLLPEADVSSVVLLLTAVVAALPAPKAGERFTRFPESEQPENGWLLDVLPDCLRRLLCLLPKELGSFPDVCLEAAERVETIRNSGFVDRDELNELHALVAERPALRWQLALEIARSEEIHHATSRLIWDGGCLVTFRAADIQTLIVRANDADTPKEARDIWFEIGMDLAFRELKGLRRTITLQELASGPDKATRENRITALKSQWLAGARQRRQFKREDRQREIEKRAAHERDRERLNRDIESIREGTNAGMLRWLVSYSFSHSGRDSLTKVDFDVITRDFGGALAVALASGLIIVWSRARTPNPADYPNGDIPWEAITGLAGLHVLMARGTDIATLNAEDAARAALLAVWELNGPPAWFERLAVTHENAVSAALHPWMHEEALSLSDGRRGRGALELALRCPTPIRTMLLRPLVLLVKENRIANSETLKGIVGALREDKLLERGVASAVCKARVEDSLSPEGFVSEVRWLRAWFEEDLRAAWTWFESHVAGLGEAEAGKQVQAFARAMIDGKWLESLMSNEDIAAVVRMHALLSAHLPAPGSSTATDEEAVFGDPVSRLMESIPRALVAARGTAANRALVQLKAAETDSRRKSWLEARALEHASLEAQHFALIEPSVLKMLAAPFLHPPRDERQLFHQVIGRLEEIRGSVEGGPFSERILFRVGIPEKHLQLWLAARFLETNNRRFSVHREEVVDADNRTDVQLSCPYGNVCVELKPLDRTRTYSATSLVETLRTQIVGQYLRGLNSGHGILVLMRLDRKTWHIPGEARGQNFCGLLQYLNSQAEAIKSDSPGIRELRVFGIDCVS